MGCRCILAADRVEFVIPDTICAVAAHSLAHPTGYFDLFSGYCYHFWETHMFREQLASHWQLNVLDLYRDTRWDEFARNRTRSLPIDDPNLWPPIHKVQPMQKALKDMKA